MIYKFFKNVETIEELYSQYKRFAMQHHPDHGGRVEDMQRINAEYDDLKKRVGNMHKSKDGGTYQTEDTDTNAPEAFKDIINAVINFNIDLELCGAWLWAFKAFAYKDQLKALGFFYCSSKKAWAWTAEPTKKSKHRLTLDEIRETYGSEQIKKATDQRKKISGAA
ncbi:MAG: molecular chaperone DnaJ [Firmicutes bacterium]|nr:molecular chaperone DnaJ [Bacillota bacterium]